MAAISESVRQQIMARADERCEYCLTSRRVIGMPLVVDHILPRALGGCDEIENLCAACYRCNQYKSAKSHEYDPASGELAPLFHPRRDIWAEHFAWANGGTHIIGLTSTGRVTVIALRMNNDYVVEARRLWIARQWHPPAQ